MQVLMMLKRNSLDKDCHHKKGEECECMNTLILMLPKNNQIRLLSRLLQQTFKG